MIIKASNFFRFTVLTCLFFSIIIPSTHVFSYSINLFGLLFDAFDLVFALLIILSVVSFLLYIDLRLLKDRKIILIVSLFLLVNFIYLIFGLIKYEDLNQSLYDFRVIAYYLIILLPFNHLGFNKILDLKILLDVFLFSLFFYSILLITVFIFPENHLYTELLSSDEFLGLGRIGFQQDYLYIIAIPLCIAILNSKIYSLRYKFFIIVCFLTFILKIFLGMSRGLILAIFLVQAILIFNNYKLSRFIKYHIIKKFFKWLIFIFISIFLIFYLIIPILFDDSENIIFYFFSRFVELFKSNNVGFIETHILNRTEMLNEGINQVFDSYFLGHGYGYLFSIDHPEWFSVFLSFIDSSYITLLIRSGIISFILFLMIFIGIILILHSFEKKITSKINDDLIFFINIFKISLIIILIYSAVNSFLVFSKSALSLLLMISIFLSIIYCERRIYST